MLNRTGPGIEPCGATLVTGLQLDFVPLMTTLPAQQFSRFAVTLTVHSSGVYFISLAMKMLLGDRVKRLTKLKINNIHCSALIHPASHLILFFTFSNLNIFFSDAHNTLSN